METLYQISARRSDEPNFQPGAVMNIIQDHIMRSRTELPQNDITKLTP